MPAPVEAQGHSVDGEVASPHVIDDVRAGRDRGQRGRVRVGFASRRRDVDTRAGNHDTCRPEPRVQDELLAGKRAAGNRDRIVLDNEVESTIGRTRRASRTAPPAA